MQQLACRWGNRIDCLHADRLCGSAFAANYGRIFERQSDNYTWYQLCFPTHSNLIHWLSLTSFMRVSEMLRNPFGCWVMAHGLRASLPVALIAAWRVRQLAYLLRVSSRKHWHAVSAAARGRTNRHPSIISSSSIAFSWSCCWFWQTFVFIELSWFPNTLIANEHRLNTVNTAWWVCNRQGFR